MRQSLEGVPTTRSHRPINRNRPFTRKIIDYLALKYLEKLASLDMYDDVRDTNEHFMYFDTILKY